MPPQDASVPFYCPSYIPLACFCTHVFRELKLVLEKQSNVFLWKWAQSTIHHGFTGSSAQTAEKAQEQLKIKCRWAEGQSRLVGALLLVANSKPGERRPKLKCVTLLLSQAGVWCKNLILAGLIQNLPQKSLLLGSGILVSKITLCSNLCIRAKPNNVRFW